MTYEEWFESHYAKHKKIVEKLSHLSDDEIIEYFRFENMVEKEPEFCPLYKENRKCHDTQELNCYLCGCPNFRLTDGKEKLKSFCGIDSKDGKQFVGEKAIHQDCSGCLVPHRDSYVKKHFNRDWMSIMKQVKTKKLYMVSLGPGDFEHVTIKALKALKDSDIICVPTKSKDNSFSKSMTYKIIKDLMNEFGFEKEIVPVYAPMNFTNEAWQKQVDILMECLERVEKISFVTLGDSAVYSTVYYLLDIIEKSHKDIHRNSEVIPGITSFSTASAKVKKPLCLGDNSFEIVPLFDENLPKTKIYMRPKIGMSTENIKENGKIYTFENLNNEGENITPSKIDKVNRYMTLFVDFC